MTLTIPAKPPILTCSDQDWYRWFAFFSLPLEHKIALIDQYPDLLIERPPTAEYKDGPKVRVFFNPDAFDTQVKYNDVMKFWDRVTIMEGLYPRQKADFTVELTKEVLFKGLTVMNHAVIGYKYRYFVRPEDYFFGMDFEQALCDISTLSELATFYDGIA